MSFATHDVGADLCDVSTSRIWTGTVLSKDKGAGTLEVQTSSGTLTIPAHYNCPDDGLDTDLTAFDVDDEVLILVRPGGSKLVFGFADGPRACGGGAALQTKADPPNTNSYPQYAFFRLNNAFTKVVDNAVGTCLTGESRYGHLGLRYDPDGLAYSNPNVKCWDGLGDGQENAIIAGETKEWSLPCLPDDLPTGHHYRYVIDFCWTKDWDILLTFHGDTAGDEPGEEYDYVYEMWYFPAGTLGNPNYPLPEGGIRVEVGRLQLFTVNTGERLIDPEGDNHPDNTIWEWHHYNQFSGYGLASRQRKDTSNVHANDDFIAFLQHEWQPRSFTYDTVNDAGILAVPDPENYRLVGSVYSTEPDSQDQSAYPAPKAMIRLRSHDGSKDISIHLPVISPDGYTPTQGRLYMSDTALYHYHAHESSPETLRRITRYDFDLNVTGVWTIPEPDQLDLPGQSSKYDSFNFDISLDDEIMVLDGCGNSVIIELEQNSRWRGDFDAQHQIRSFVFGNDVPVKNHVENQSVEGVEYTYYAYEGVNYYDAIVAGNRRRFRSQRPTPEG